jgi:hypothetical protein
MTIPEAIAGVIIGALIAGAISIITSLIQKDERRADRVDERKRWEAAFYLPRQIDAVTNLYASLVDLYSSFQGTELKVSPEGYYTAIEERYIKEADKLDIESLRAAIERQPSNIPEKERLHNAVTELAPGLDPKGIGSELLRDLIFSHPENMTKIRTEAHNAYMVYKRCKALAYVYLTPQIYIALEQVEQAYHHMVRGLYPYLYKSGELPEIIAQTNWSAIEEPYRTAVDLLKAQLNPVIFTQ